MQAPVSKSRFDTSGAKRALEDRRMGAVGVRSAEFDRLLALAPDRTCDASHELELALLLFLTDPVALHGGSEATLRAQRQSLERDVPRRLLDPLLQLALGLELWLLGRDEAEDGESVFRQVRERLEASRAPVVVLEQKPVEESLLEDARNRLVVTFGVVLALVVAAADVEPKGHARMALDDRIVELDAAVDQLLGVAPPLTVALPHGRVEEGSVLRRVDLYVRAAEADQLIHLAPREVDHVREVLVAGRVGALRLFRVIVGGSLLGADHRHLARTPRRRPEKRPLFAGHTSLPAQAIDHHRALQDQLLPTLVAEGNRPAALAVESLEGVDEVAVEGVATELAIGHHIDAGPFLDLDRGPDRRIFDCLELRLRHLAGLQPLAGADQVRRSQEAADDLGSPGW